MRILGIDPGSWHAGFGLVERRGSRLVLVEHGRISCPRGAALGARLGLLAERLEEVLHRTQPDRAAVESAFHGRNSRSLIVLAEARGALLATLSRHGLEPHEYSPAEVKSAVTGNGRAEKSQVARMVRLLLALAGTPLPADTTDALAVAICCAQRARTLAAIERGRR